MFTILKVGILVGLLRLYIETERPLLCAGIYAGVAAFFRLVLSAPMLQVIVGAGVAFVLSFVYFGLLSRFETGTVWWWIVMLGGLVIGLV